MIGYIRDPRTWSAVKTVTVTSYELPLETAQGETGKVTLLGQMDADYSRYLFSLEGMIYLFKVTGQQTGDSSETTLTICDGISAFEQQRSTVQYDNRSYFDALFNMFGDKTWNSTTLQNCVMSSKYAPTYGILDCFDNDAKRIKIYQWMRAEEIPISEFVADEFGTSGNATLRVYSYEDVLRVIKSHGAGVRIDCVNSNGRNALIVRFDYFGFADTTPVLFSDGHSELLSESHNDDICSCVIIYNGSTRSEYYLSSDGTISDDRASQIVGHTTAKVLASGESAADAAAEIFASNTYSHKIEFASDKELHIGQPVRLMLSRGVLDTAISKVMLKSGDDRFYYTCGELPVTATERIKADGWTYGSRLPSNPRKGQLFIEV